jgi:hypothetical protein
MDGLRHLIHRRGDLQLHDDVLQLRGRVDGQLLLLVVEHGHLFVVVFLALHPSLLVGVGPVQNFHKFVVVQLKLQFNLAL